MAGTARKASRSTSRSRKSTSKSPARSKKSPAKRTPSKSPARGRSTSRGRTAAKRTPSKTRAQSQTKTKKATPPRSTTRSSSRSRVQQTPSASSVNRQAHSEPASTLEDIRQRVQRIREASRFAPISSSSPPRPQQKKPTGASATNGGLLGKLCPSGWCKNLDVRQYINANQKDLLASVFILFFILSTIYLVLYTDPLKARQWLERLPQNTATFWKGKVYPKIKFW